MSFIDAKINLGYEEEIAKAIASYIRVPLESVDVSNDPVAPELTVITLEPVNPKKPRVKMALKELERFKGAMIDVVEGEDDNGKVVFRIDDKVICDFTQEHMEREAKKNPPPAE